MFGFRIWGYGVGHRGFSERAYIGEFGYSLPMFDTLQIFSIALEAGIAVIFLMIAIRGRAFMFGLALTFTIYVGYDLAREFAWEVSPPVLIGGFFVATVSALYSAVKLFRRL